MNTLPDITPDAEDRAFTESVLGRTAICAIAWYPERAEREQDWSLQKDLDWCLAPLKDTVHGTELCRLVEASILDPTRYRRELVIELRAIAGEE